MQAQLVLENVGVRYPGRVLFEGVNWTLYEGMRVALAGRNGCGKSTLLKILSGRMESPEGTRTVVGGKNLRIGFLDQSHLDSAVLQIAQLKDRTVSAVTFLAQKTAATLEDTLPEEIEWEVRKILSGLGFSPEWMDGPIAHLSGGWLLRLFIAECLLQKPQVLLLDEPTNHLDLSSIQWLEEFLQKEYEGSLILVTHDVALQRRTTDSIAIVHGGRFFFRSHINDYVTFRESLSEEKEIIRRTIDALQKKIDENMDFVFRFRAKAQTAARAQSKLKMAEAQKEEMAQLKEKLQRIEGQSYNLSFNFRMSGVGGKFPVSLKNLSFRYSENGPWLLKNINLDIKRGQRIAIIGDNGTGKTTLLNVLADRLKPTEGERLLAHAVETGYFGQHQLDELSLDNSVFDNLRSRAVGVSMEEMRGWLGAFGFGAQEEVEKKVKFLSGGERARLAMLRILVTRINFCLLDEPTNHLDIETKALLTQAIKGFEGTTVFVSHDREFVSEIAERIIYLSHDHVLTDHLGNLDSFFEKYPQYVRHLEGGRAKPSQAPVAESAPSGQPGASLSYEERKKVRNQIKSLERKLATLETDMEKWGEEKNKLGSQMQSATFNSAVPPEERNTIVARYSQLETLLHGGMVDWEKYSLDLEALRKL